MVAVVVAVGYNVRLSDPNVDGGVRGVQNEQLFGGLDFVPRPVAQLLYVSREVEVPPIRWALDRSKKLGARKLQAYFVRVNPVEHRSHGLAVVVVGSKPAVVVFVHTFKHRRLRGEVGGSPLLSGVPSLYARVPDDQGHTTLLAFRSETAVRGRQVLDCDSPGLLVGRGTIPALVKQQEYDAKVPYA